MSGWRSRTRSWRSEAEAHELEERIAENVAKILKGRKHERTVKNGNPPQIAGAKS